VAPRRHSGSQCRDQEERGANVAGEHLVEYRRIELRRRAESRDSGVVDQDVDVAGLACQPLHIGSIGEVGGDETGLAARGGDLLDRLCASFRVTAVNDDLGSIPGQLQRDRPTNARCRARHQRPLPFKVFLLDR
jgi:hypothetical protein